MLLLSFGLVSTLPVYRLTAPAVLSHKTDMPRRAYTAPRLVLVIESIPAAARPGRAQGSIAAIRAGPRVALAA